MVRRFGTTVQPIAGGRGPPPTLDGMAHVQTLYDDAGGMPFFEQLVGHFYDAVERDDLLRPLYPEELGPPRRHLTLFLAQYWGGPSDYDAERGHPRLRMRHVPFAIGPAERDRWLELMRDAIRSMNPPRPVADSLREYFDMAAEAMRNRG
jgi:hemoglobin